MARKTLWLDFRVKGFHPDPETNQPILVLEEAQGRFLLPIWIGVPEAGAIAAHLGGHTLPRPMTHDLAHTLVTLLGGQVVRLDVRDVIDGTFYADLVVRDGSGRERVVDCRPSDGVALALRFDARIRVSAAVMNGGAPILVEEPRPETLPIRAVAVDDWAARARLGVALEETEPDAFGKFTA